MASNDITVEMDSAIGPHVVVQGDHDETEIEDALPEGWTVGDNWGNGVERADGSYSYPLVQVNRYENESDGEIWSILVGSQSVREFVENGGVPEVYVRETQTCEDLTEDERETVAEAMSRYIEANVEPPTLGGIEIEEGDFIAVGTGAEDADYGVVQDVRGDLVTVEWLANQTTTTAASASLEGGTLFETREAAREDFVSRVGYDLRAIHGLRDESGEAGDLDMVAICDRALDGDADAVAECQRVLREAKAQAEGAE